MYPKNDNLTKMFVSLQYPKRQSEGTSLNNIVNLSQVNIMIHYFIIIMIIALIGVYLNLFKSTQSAAGLKVLKPAANGRYLMCKSSPYYFHLLYRSTFIVLSAKCMLGLFVFPQSTKLWQGQQDL